MLLNYTSEVENFENVEQSAVNNIKNLLGTNGKLREVYWFFKKLV
jgi:hypothetical protein